ncbi:TRAP transporter small permease subunit [Caldifermentibacillus hisashii]|jgi:TRAP-type C4-dicarboxylate transport system permease small subunit|uniref:TRAP transporter small permease n=1 Tax=Caldifermentibacillus hisashii TaxID=996558 RepID=UPI0031FC7AAA
MGKIEDTITTEQVDYSLEERIEHVPEIIKKIDSYTNWLDKSLRFLGITFLILSTIFAFINVVLRYGFGISYAIIEELCRYFIIYGSFAYIGPLIKMNEHIKMDMLSNVLKGKSRHLNYLIINIIQFSAFAFLCYTGALWVNFMYSMHLMTSSGYMLMVIPTIALPIGMLLGCIYSLLEIVKGIFSLRGEKTR